MQYFDDVLKVCGIAVLCVIALMVTTRLGNFGIGTAIRLCGGLLIFGVFVVVLKDNLEMLESVLTSSGADTSHVVRAFDLMLKALGVALLSKLCADICRDCGENTLASGVEGVGRVAIFSLTLPVISEIIEYASRMLGT